MPSLQTLVRCLDIQDMRFQKWTNNSKPRGYPHPLNHSLTFSYHSLTNKNDVADMLCIQGVPKTRTWFWSLITTSDFTIKTFTSNHSKNEVFNFLFDAWLRPFRKTEFCLVLNQRKACQHDRLFNSIRRKNKQILK